jgi:hypothetical protein
VVKNLIIVLLAGAGVYLFVIRNKRVKFEIEVEIEPKEGAEEAAKA